LSGPTEGFLFPLVGDIVAEGMTLSELDNAVTKKLTEFIKSPEVSIIMKQFGISGTGSGGANRGISSFVKVYDLSLDNVKVRPDGKISFPLVGDTLVEGLTLDELRVFLSSKIARYVHNIDVYVQVNEFGGKKVIVLGEVSTPGTYKTTGPVSVLEAISLAGGYTRDAILRNVFVVRGDLNNPEVIRLNLSKAVTGKDFAENIPIKAGDVVYVPRSLISDISYVVSLILQPLSSSSAGVSSIQTIRGGTSPIK
jgi:Periplasmic protein involved in polysaccharide export